ncbi:MAG: ROK family protein [Candidatus Nanohalobium sp.]
MAFLCVDIGGTNTLLGIGNGGFQVIEKFDTEKFLRDVNGKVNEALNDIDYSRDELEKVAVAAAGPIDREEKTFRPPNFSNSGLGEVDLGEAFQDFGEIYVVNDGTAAVVGEYHYGDHDAENLVYVTISSGIGAGVILEGRVIEAWNGNFGEVGHMKINEEGPECGCGGTAHWEAYSSGDNLPEMAEELFDAQFNSALEIFRAYQDYSSVAEKVISKMHEANTIGVTNIANVFNPEKIVFGGAIPLNHTAMILEPLRNEVKRESINRPPEIELCDLEEYSVLHGLRAVCNGEFKPSQL